MSTNKALQLEVLQSSKWSLALVDRHLLISCLGLLPAVVLDLSRRSC